MDEKMNEIPDIDKERIDKTAEDPNMRMGKLNDNMPKAQNLQLVGKFLKDKYYPELSLDEINERVDILMEKDKKLTLNAIVEKIEHGELNLVELSMDDLRNETDDLGKTVDTKDQDDGPSLED